MVLELELAEERVQFFVESSQQIDELLATLHSHLAGVAADDLGRHGDAEVQPRLVLVQSDILVAPRAHLDAVGVVVIGDGLLLLNAMLLLRGLG